MKSETNGFAHAALVELELLLVLQLRRDKMKNFLEDSLGPLLFAALVLFFVLLAIMSHTRSTSKIWVDSHINLDARCYVMTTNGWHNEELIHRAARSDAQLRNYQADRNSRLRYFVHPTVDELSPIDCGLKLVDNTPR